MFDYFANFFSSYFGDYFAATETVVEVTPKQYVIRASQSYSHGVTASQHYVPGSTSSQSGCC